MEDIKLSSWHSYGKINALGHRSIKTIFEGEVVIEEKIDGSQFSWGMHDGELKMKSHHKELHHPVDQKLFMPVAETVHTLFQKGLLTEGWTYRGEAVTKPKHNCLAYDRTPKSFLVLFDVEVEQNQFLPYESLVYEADRLGVEAVKKLWSGNGEEATQAMLVGFLAQLSQLGGQLIEGMVVKNYHKFGEDGHVLMGKYVSEKFKEVQKGDWKTENPGQGDIIQRLIDEYKSEARWHKAVQHLKEKGELLDDPKDIGPLIKEINVDVRTECSDEIKEKLFVWAWKQINNGLTRGFPEWYKKELLGYQFEVQPPEIPDMTDEVEDDD